MPIPMLRVKQSTSTPGTGSLVLNAATAAFRSFQSYMGAGTFAQRFGLQKDGAREISYGTIDTATGQITRDTTVDSSSGGAPVSFTGVTDVFFDFLPGDRQFRTINVSTTLPLADIGNVIRCTQSADITATLPPLASVPGGPNLLCMGYVIFNDGSNGSIVWIDPNASETLDGVSNPFPLFVGESLYVFGLGTTWRSINRPRGERLVRRSSASAVASVDLILPHYVSAARSRYRLEYRQVRSANNGAALLMQMSPDAGVTWRSSYSVAIVRNVASGGAPGDPNNSAGALNLSTDFDSSNAGHHIQGSVAISPGAAGARRASIEGGAFNYGNGGWGGFAGPQVSRFGGHSNLAEDIDAIRLKMDSGNINLGDFSLFALYD